MPSTIARLAVAVAILASCSGGSAATPGPTPVHLGWHMFSSPDYGYSLSYPPTWFDVGNFGIPDNHWFSNDKSATSPLNLRADAFFLGIDANCGYILGPRPTLIEDVNVVVGGTRAVRYVETSLGDEGALAAAMVSVSVGEYCYRFYMLARALEVVQANLADFDAMLSTVRFAHRSAPAQSPRPTVAPG